MFKPSAMWYDFTPALSFLLRGPVRSLSEIHGAGSGPSGPPSQTCLSITSPPSWQLGLEANPPCLGGNYWGRNLAHMIPRPLRWSPQYPKGLLSEPNEANSENASTNATLLPSLPPTHITLTPSGPLSPPLFGLVSGFVNNAACF